MGHFSGLEGLSRAHQSHSKTNKQRQYTQERRDHPRNASNIKFHRVKSSIFNSGFLLHFAREGRNPQAESEWRGTEVGSDTSNARHESGTDIFHCGPLLTTTPPSWTSPPSTPLQQDNNLSPRHKLQDAGTSLPSLTFPSFIPPSSSTILNLIL